MTNLQKLLSTIIIAFVLTSSLSACSGNCDYPTDRAKDGSICGDRAASVRPGGRNPDTDWIIWLVVVGGAIAWFVSSNNKKDRNNTPPTSKHANNRASFNRAPNDKPLPINRKPTSNVNAPKEHVSVSGDKTQKTQTKIDISKVKRILQLDFNYVSPPYLKVSLEAVCEQTGEMGGTNFDAAARLILVEIGSYEGMNGDNINWFVDAQTQNLFKYKSRMTIGTVGLVHALNMFRAFRGLPDL
mgnify:CR=1 FL=1